MDPIEKHQGSQKYTGLNGVIPRIERQIRHERFINGYSDVDIAMLPIDHAERLLRKGITASSYTDTSLITTTTIPDKDLKGLDWETERDIVESFGPEYHIPTDYWVYGDMDVEDRCQNLRYMMSGTEWMVEQLSNTSTTIVPLVKGYSREERQICYTALNRMGIDHVAFYGTQYFGGKSGNGICNLNEDVRDIVSEFGPSEMLLIGLQSKKYTPRLPPEVSAVAGQGWIRKSQLRDGTIAEAREEYSMWKQGIEQNLSSGIAALGSFTAQTEVSA